MDYLSSVIWLIQGQENIVETHKCLVIICLSESDVSQRYSVRPFSAVTLCSLVFLYFVRTDYIKDSIGFTYFKSTSNRSTNRNMLRSMSQTSLTQHL